MNQHLSPEQIDGWIIGERLPEVEGHLHTCSACADEVARCTESLQLFGAAMRSCSEEQMGSARVPRAASTGFPRWWQVGLAFATLLLLLIARPVFVDTQARRQATIEAVRKAAQDEILLRQVEQEVAQSVPTPMEPLAKLMPNDLTR